MPGDFPRAPLVPPADPLCRWWVAIVYDADGAALDVANLIIPEQRLADVKDAARAFMLSNASEWVTIFTDGSSAALMLESIVYEERAGRVLVDRLPESA